MEYAMKKKSSKWLPVLLLALLLTGCRRNTPDPAKEQQLPDTIALTVWAAEEDEELLRQIIDGFKAEYHGQADFEITY